MEPLRECPVGHIDGDCSDFNLTLLGVLFKKPLRLLNVSRICIAPHLPASGGDLAPYADWIECWCPRGRLAEPEAESFGFQRRENVKQVPRLEYVPGFA